MTTTTTRQSVNLSSINPLSANGVFIPPRWDDLLQFPGVILSLRGDTNMRLELYESTNGANTMNTKIYYVDKRQPLNIQFNLGSRYFKLALFNLENQAQTILNLQTIYSNLHIPQAIESSAFKIWNDSVLATTNQPSIGFNSNFRNTLFTFYGNASAATVLTVQLSNDDIDYYNTQTTYTISSAGNFGFSYQGIFNYIRLISSAAITITTFINFK
jgi:hypothetical protein